MKDMALINPLFVATHMHPESPSKTDSPTRIPIVRRDSEKTESLRLHTEVEPHEDDLIRRGMHYLHGISALIFLKTPETFSRLATHTNILSLV